MNGKANPGNSVDLDQLMPMLSRVKSSSSKAPVTPPAKKMTFTSPPSSVMALATLTPPPPASKTSLKVRILWMPVTDLSTRIVDRGV